MSLIVDRPDGTSGDMPYYGGHVATISGKIEAFEEVKAGQPAKFAAAEAVYQLVGGLNC